MNKHIKYLSYLLKHKWYVFVECCKLGIPFRGIIHDWQKFLPIEWVPYTLSFYGPWKYNDRPDWLKDSFDRAWNHHIHHGPHHWQYWILTQDSGPRKILEMPDKYKKEMLADWRGASLAINGVDKTESWFYKNYYLDKNIILHENTVKWLERQLYEK